MTGVILSRNTKPPPSAAAQSGWEKRLQAPRWDDNGPGVQVPPRPIFPGDPMLVSPTFSSSPKGKHF